jgi:hypothetical protein
VREAGQEAGERERGEVYAKQVSTDLDSSHQLTTDGPLPRDSEQWASIGAEELVLRRCCSWKSLLGSPASTNRVNIKIHMDRAKRFDVEQLRRLMLLASRAEQVTHAD